MAPRRTLATHDQRRRGANGMRDVIETTDFALQMKVYLQHDTTLEFVQKPGDWTPEIDEAMVFSDTNCAIEFCLEHELSGMQIVLHFSEFGYDVHLPVKLPRASRSVST